ncbi:MAG: hypothetical protein PVG22_16430, partial [Chromatiales bacterium]
LRVRRFATPSDPTAATTSLGFGCLVWPPSSESLFSECRVAALRAQRDICGWFHHVDLLEMILVEPLCLFHPFYALKP